MSWQEDYKKKLVTPEEAVSHIKSGDRVGVPGGPGMPFDLMVALGNRYEELKDVNIYSGITMYMLDMFKPEYRGHINFYTLFMGPLERIFLKQKGNVNVVSYHMSSTSVIMDHYDVNVAMIEVSAPDERGFMSLGLFGVTNGLYAMQRSDLVIAQVNKHMPYVTGLEAVVHVNDIDFFTENDHPIASLPEIPVTPEDEKIGAFIADLVPDGATVQLGIGGTSNIVGALLKDKKDLGIHTEMMVDSMMTLYDAGAVTNMKKTFHKGKMLTGFCIGSQELYKFVDRNSIVEFAPVMYTNDPINIAKNDNFMSINNTITADLTGQCASESIGHQMYSGTGGQLNFIRGAAMSKGGKSFLALPSSGTTKEGKRYSRIVTNFLPGTVVTTPRSDVHYIVTEFGAVDMRLESIPARVKKMISIAHPDFRDQLAHEAKEAGLVI
ncbi:MAG: 4-hydroxybutyrate CoA-transferase [Deltaproteobacteria bacterium]|nr:4-hydroxybutyrate CoA-transferase [Candidatus Zymogenaceae bacterium]